MWQCIFGSSSRADPTLPRPIAAAQKLASRSVAGKLSVGTGSGSTEGRSVIAEWPKYVARQFNWWQMHRHQIGPSRGTARTLMWRYRNPLSCRGCRVPESRSRRPPRAGRNTGPATRPANTSIWKSFAPPGDGRTPPGAAGLPPAHPWCSSQNMRDSAHGRT